MAALASIPRHQSSSASQISQNELEKTNVPPLAMFRVKNSDAIEGVVIEKNKWGSGALVRVQNEAAEAAERDVCFFVTHSDLLPSCWLSSLRRVNLHGPSGEVLRGISRE